MERQGNKKRKMAKIYVVHIHVIANTSVALL